MWPDRWAEVRRSGPLLLGGLVACSAAVAGLTNAVAEPPFEIWLHLMLVLGFGASLLGAAFRINFSFIGIGIIGAAIAASVYRGAPAPVLSVAFPPEVVADEDLTWATLWAWLMVGLSFMQAKRRNILFCLVSGLAVLGLTATVNLNTIVLVYFGVFLFAAIFVWGYEHLLNLGERAAPVVGHADTDRVWPWLARTQALASTTLMAAVMLSALVLGGLLYAAGPRLYLSPTGMSRYVQWVRVSLLSYGGMLNTFYVGRGPVNLSATAAIEVKADKAALWRGQAYDRYTGNGWTKDLTRARELIALEDGWLGVPDAEEPRGEMLHQVVTLVGMESRAFYSATRSVKVRAAWARRSGVRTLRYHAQVDPYDSVMTTFMMMPGAEYEVISELPPNDPESLRACPATYSPEMVERYIEQIPVGAAAGLQQLVTEITAGAANPYDRVLALRDYIEEKCVYTSRAPAIPRAQDAAAYFVTRSRKGACDLFSTGLAVMCRLAGVPARVATGFQTGTYDPERGVFVALHKDAHAWAEVYFPTVGWVPFDAAARRNQEEGGMAAFLASAKFARRLREVVGQASRVGVAVLALAALFSAIFGPRAAVQWLRRKFRRRHPRARLGEVYERFRRRAARRAGLRPQRWQTPHEMAEALVSSGAAGSASVRKDLDRFTTTFYATRYGPHEPSEQHVRRMGTLARRVLHALKRERRGRNEAGT